MKNKITRSLIVFVLLCVTVITLMSFCACQKDDDTQPSGNQPSGNQPSGDQPQKDIPHYDSLSSRVIRIYFDDMNGYPYYQNKIVTVNSLSDLEKCNILGTSFSEEYFDNYVILLITFHSRSSDGNIEFKDIAIKDGKFYPIFATNTNLDIPVTDDSNWGLYMVGVDKRVLNYQFQDILVINRLNVNWSSGYHRSITTVFE